MAEKFNWDSVCLEARDPTHIRRMSTNTLPGIISIDGSIGAGKTTVMKSLVQQIERNGLDARWPRTLDLEPVEIWEPYLERAYHEHNGWFRLQMRVIRDRMWPPAHAWIERSLYFQERVFVRPAVKDGRILPEEADIICDMYSLAASRWKPEVYVYLRSSPEGCYARMKSRGRHSEADVPLTYLQALHADHERALDELIRVKEAPVVVVEVEGKTPEDIAGEILVQTAPYLGVLHT